ncbi:cytochrome P450 [Candidatus Gracilibacteria bacterium]|jgi:cytochrome P450 family 110|nr:cytochrome P450 [Candidatus Gracilibacteria bacterium]NJM89547.1 cytochrome P450 [Hydrococcus sp. RU_2_2]NJP20243.1 cytochrome P450 [Hydrococcus sp. CRU_1_1]
MKRPDGPKTPKFIQRLEWILDPVGYMERSHERYPDLFVAKVIGFGGTIVYVSHPQAIQQLLTNDRKQFSAPSETNRILEPLIGDNSVIMLEGDRHRKRRQLVMPPFHGDRMRTYGELICNVTRKVMSQLPTGKPFLARSAMQSISLQVILEVVFGLYEGERCQQLRQLMSEMGEVFRSPISSGFLFLPALQKDWGAWSPWGKFVRQRQQIDDLLYAEIAERRANPDRDRTDILSMLMSARDEEGQPMSDRELRDELMALMFAGHETTATAMAWALYWTHYLPEVRDKILSELNSLGDSPALMDIARLPYLTAVCQETLRIHPVAMLTFPRVAQEPVEMMGYLLEPGTVVMGCMYLTHQREDIYPNHREFKPERFLERQFSPYEFIPFGGGVRRCIGEALAQFEMKLVLATILSEYQLTLVEKKRERPQRRGVTLAPESGVKMQILGTSDRTEIDRLLMTQA